MSIVLYPVELTHYFPPAGNILDHLVGEDIIADYLLYSLNRLGNFRCDCSQHND